MTRIYDDPTMEAIDGADARAHRVRIDAISSTTDSPEVDLFAALLAQLAAPQPVHAPSPPFVCGDVRLLGQHLWLKDGPGTHTGQPLICECGARARRGFEGELYAVHGYGPPPANPIARRAA